MPRWLKSVLIAVGCVVLVGGGIYGVLRLVKSRSASEVNVYSMNDVSTFYSYFDQSETEGLVTTDRIQSVYVTNTQQVTDVYVQEGQIVEIGDPILAFDTTLSDLELERKRIEIEQLKLDLENAKTEREEMNSYGVYSGGSSAATDEDKNLTSVTTPYLRKGSGTADDPYIFLWGELDTYSSAFISSSIFKGLKIEPVVPVETPVPSESPTPDETPIPDGDADAEPVPTPDAPADEDGTDETTTEETTTDEGTTEETTTEGTTTEESTTEETTTEETTAGETATETAEETSTSETPVPESSAAPVPTATPDPNAGTVRYAIFERRESDSPEGELLDVWQMVFEVSKNGELAFTLGDPDPDYDSDESESGADTGYVYSGPTYTWSELQKMKAEADQKIIDLGFQLRSAELEYETIEYELSNGVVYSKIDGVVKTVRTVEEALAENQPLVLVSGGGGYYAQGYMGELDLETMRVGDTVDVMSWQSGESMTGTITEISDYPLDEDDYGYYWSQGNSNISKYPFTIFLDEDSPLREGEYVNITFTPGETQTDSDGDKFYLQNPFLRQENGRSYVYVQGEEDRLEKRYVTTGKNLWGSYTEIKAGLTLDDYIAFPYGKSVTEGAKTVQAGIEDLYNSYY